MATNIKTSVDKSYNKAVVPSDGGATPNAPARYGTMTGVSLTGTTTIAGDSKATIAFGPVEALLSVKGVDAGGNSAVAVGDKLYYVDADTPKISKKVAGTFFGYALEAVTSGATATIRVEVKGF
jgi:hypothetical protein